MNTSKDSNSVGVAGRPIQAEDAGRRASWAEPSVWTERMWTALENGVKGGKWYSLIDKVWKEKTLRKSFERVAANKGNAGVDHISVERFRETLDEEVPRLSQTLRSRTYRPQALKRISIRKEGGNGRRPLSIPTVRDRTLQTALRHVIEPIYERTFADCSYGFRPERSCKDALREVEGLLKDGWTHVVDADLSQCFDTIPHAPLLERMREQVADERLLQLIEAFLKQGIMEAGKEWEPEEGTPQGGPLSPLLANIYLNPIDWMMNEAGCRIVRYADDLVLLCRSRAEAEKARKRLESWVHENGLMLNSEKTHTVDMTEQGANLTFLGYRFYRTQRGKLRRLARKKSEKKLRNSLRAHTKRCSGHSLDEIIRRINPVLRGWFEYYKHAHPSQLAELDGWVRMRLRSILRKRQKGRGRGRGLDHQRWPNAYFKEHGLFSLAAARASCCPSPRG